MGKPPWNKGLTKYDDKRLMSVSKKTREQRYRDYANGTRDQFEITKKANQTLREKGQYTRDNSYLGKNHVGEEARKRLSEQRMGAGNPMYGKKPWNKLYPTKKWWEETEFIKLRKKCLERDNHCCVNCGATGIDLYCDHKIPYRICKEHKLDNLQMMCGSCHSKKTVEDVKNFNLKS